MSPTRGWDIFDRVDVDEVERAYYRASRAARRAWQATNAQLELGLDPGEVSRADATAAASPESSPPSITPLPRAGSPCVPAEEVAAVAAVPTTEAMPAISVSSASAGRSEP